MNKDLLYLIIKTIHSFWKNGLGMDTNIIKILKIYLEEDDEDFKIITPSKFRSLFFHYFNTNENFEIGNIKNMKLFKKKLLSILKLNIKLNTNSKDKKIEEELELRAEILLDTLLFLIKNQKGINSKLLETIIPNEIITIGISKKAKKNKSSYNEHLVPRIFIIKELIKMHNQNATYEEMTKLIINNLKVLIILEEEAKYLDNCLLLKEVMPKNWNFGDDIFDRLKEGNIEYELY